MDVSKIKEKIEGIKEEIEFYIWNFTGFFRQLKERILGTIEVLVFVNKTCSYRNWDFCYLYYYIEWKLKRMRDTIIKNDIIADSEEVKNQINEALEYLNTYFNVEDYVERPKWMEDRGWWLGESMTPEREEESTKYYMDLYNQEKEAWDNFHECLKKYAQNWWD